MKSSSTLRTLALALASTALTFSLAVCAQAQTVDFLYQFSGNQGNAVGVIQGTDGNFYGSGGTGAYAKGQIFRMTPAGEVTTIYSFCAKSGCPDGTDVTTPPALGSDGYLYGVTGSGGNSSNSGTFYKMTLDGDITTLYSFCPASGCADGQYPNGIILASDGNYYGTTELGGKHNGGTIFSISPSGTFELLYTFCTQSNCADGQNPLYPPVQGIDGNFYGTAYAGGAHNGGVIYQITGAGAYKVLYNFCSYQTSCPTGANPAPIVQDSKGNFFGTTVLGGNSNHGTVFEFTSANQYKVLHTFLGYDGSQPGSGLTLAGDGSFYGVTQGGGGPKEGNIYKVSSAGVFKSIYVFRGNEGYDPFYGLFQGTNGSLYGTTAYGPSPCCYGMIYSVSDSIGQLVETVPVAGKVGQSVIILGNGLMGSSSVKFNGKAATFTVESDTEIKATVPSGATTGKVSVVTATGTLNSSPQFVVTK
jgi:uncharacterized repeat protein (TIGR03803 family)